MTPSRDIAGLIAIMARLRDPERGCAWDVAQTFETIAPYTLEEAAEVADAIARRDMDDLRDELGDLLLQVVFHARIAEEAGAFAFDDVVEAITAKLIRRHPHVFGDAAGRDPASIRAIWDEVKRAEKAERAAQRPPAAGAGAPPPPPPPGPPPPAGGPPPRTPPRLLAPRLLDGAPRALTGLSRAVKLQDLAGAVGFDWDDARLVLAKIREEADEVEAVLDGADAEARMDEVGDLLFAVANLARHVKVDPEVALRRANAKFERRFAHIEDSLSDAGRTPADASLDEMEALWQAAKALERDG